MKHSIYKKLVVAAMLGLPAQLVFAQKTKNLSLDEAIQLSVKNSKQLKLSKARVDEAVANYHDAWNNHLPDVKISGAYMRINNPNIDLKVKLGGGSSSDTASHTSSVKVDQA